jgi:hypothetical protein
MEPQLLTLAPTSAPLAPLDSTFGSLREGVRDLLGGIQGQISIGGGEPASVDVAFGERRVMSGFALAAVAAIGLLGGLALAGRR